MDLDSILNYLVLSATELRERSHEIIHERDRLDRVTPDDIDYLYGKLDENARQHANVCLMLASYLETQGGLEKQVEPAPRKRDRLLKALKSLAG